MDSRFHLRVEFTIYHETHKWDCSLNWSADPGEIDRRITDWFLYCHNTSYDKWVVEVQEKQLEQETKRIEQAERAELLRLKQKYE